jgi:drug/metabolite transporter (DMT)-like permease
LLALGRGQSLRPRGPLARVLLRVLLGAAAILLYYRGIAGAGAGLATLLHCAYPIWTALFATTLMRERFDLSLAAAVGLCVAGIAVVVGPGAELGAAAAAGSLYALAASVLAGGAVTTARHLRMVETAYLVTTYFMAVGAVCTAPAMLAGLPPIDGLLPSCSPASCSPRSPASSSSTRASALRRRRKRASPPPPVPSAPPPSKPSGSASGSASTP